MSMPTMTVHLEDMRKALHVVAQADPAWVVEDDPDRHRLGLSQKGNRDRLGILLLVGNMLNQPSGYIEEGVVYTRVSFISYIWSRELLVRTQDRAYLRVREALLEKFLRELSRTTPTAPTPRPKRTRRA